MLPRLPDADILQSNFNRLLPKQIILISLISDGNVYQVWKGRVLETEPRKDVIVKIDKGIANDCTFTSKHYNHMNCDTQQKPYTEYCFLCSRPK